MRIKNLVIIVILIGVFVLGLAYQKGIAADKAKFNTAPKVGVVNIRYIIQKTQKQTDFMEKMQKDMEEIRADLTELSDELKKGEKALDARIKGSEDYLKMAQDLMEKEAKLQARKEFEKNLLALREKQWTEELYTLIHEKIAEISKKMGVDIVIDGNADLNKEIPAATPNELVLTIRTRKVLYFNDSVDLTTEVLEAVDAAK